jgi:5'(3')-deoxyribonucleotidase
MDYKTKYLTLVVDIDEVLRRIIPEIIKIYNAEHKTKIIEEDIKEWYLHKTFPMIKNDEEFFRKHAHQIFLKAKPEVHAIDLLNELYSNNNIILASSQFTGLENLTDLWLEKNKIKFDDLIYTRDKSKIKGDIMIDDGVHNLISSSCTHTICMARPWNESFSGRRMNSFVSFYNFVKRVENYKKQGFYDEL